MSASQAEGCEFKSRFPLQQNQAFTVKNAVKAFYFCDQIATCGRKKSCPSLSHSLPGHHIFPLQTPFSHALGMARGVFLFLLHRMSHGQTMPIEASASYGRNLVAISFFMNFWVGYAKPRALLVCNHAAPGGRGVFAFSVQTAGSSWVVPTA